MARGQLTGSALVRVFPGGEGVHGISLDVPPGHIHALVGLNGAGKTTLLRLFTGMLRPDAGTVRIEGRELHDVEPETWARFGHLVEQPFAYAELDARANLAAAARLHGVPGSRIAGMVEQILAELDIERYAQTPARVLSQGNRQRVGLACALQHAPDLIVLDEPTTALDPAGIILLRNALLRRARAGAGILVSSHHLDEVARVADRITVVNHGRTIGALDPTATDIERAFFTLVHADDGQRAA